VAKRNFVEIQQMPDGQFAYIDDPQFSHREKVFITEYLKHNNAARAARVAGYSPTRSNNAAHEIRQRPHVAHAIAQEQEASLRSEITKEQIIRNLAKIANHDVTDVFQWSEVEFAVNDQGNVVISGSPKLKPSAVLPEELTYSVKKFKVNMDGSVTLEFYDKIAALEKLARYFGLEHEGIGRADPHEMARKIQSAMSGMDRSVTGENRAEIEDQHSEVLEKSSSFPEPPLADDIRRGKT
jgi:phage terminase small subunit